LLYKRWGNMCRSSRWKEMPQRRDWKRVFDPRFVCQVVVVFAHSSRVCQLADNCQITYLTLLAPDFCLVVGVVGTGTPVKDISIWQLATLSRSFSLHVCLGESLPSRVNSTHAVRERRFHLLNPKVTKPGF
jgi:hypothetical protein